MMAQKEYTITGEPYIILGAAYFLLEIEEGIFSIVYSIYPTSDKRGFCKLDEGFEELILNEDILEIIPENNYCLLESYGEDEEDFAIRACRGLKNLARLVGSLYVSPKKKNVFGEYYKVNGKRLVLIRPRFFNRKYDIGINPHENYSP